MKKIFFIAITITLLTLVACKKVKNETMTVVRDCTGTYLRFNEKDYNVCNLEKVSSFPDGVSVTATFRKIKNCTSRAVCLIFHKNEGWIHVEKIK
ncbi:MAG: hypothetical protein V4549_19205 [Bacteroidota bacterium]